MRLGVTMMRWAMIEGKCGLPALRYVPAEATAPACAGRHEDRPRVLSRECPGSTMMHWARMEGKYGLLALPRDAEATASA